ncbi:unnamed protein product [Urochloa humidicola]
MATTNSAASPRHRVKTVWFKNELERNITIKLGYANAKNKCENDRCPRPMWYKAYGSGKEDSPSVMCLGLKTLG